MIRILIAFLGVAFMACSSDDCKKAPDVSQVNIGDIKVKRLEEEMFSLNNKNEAINFLQENPDFAEVFLDAPQYPHDSTLAAKIYDLINDPYIDSLYRQTTSHFDDLSSLEQDYESAFKYVKYYYPTFEVPEIRTAITGLSHDLFVSDSLIVIGLDYFIGKDAIYKPVGLPQYMLRRYSREYLVPSSLLLLSNNFNHTNYQNTSMLADMIYYGKAYYFVEKMLPCTSDSLIIGYTAEEVGGAYYNAGTIWSHFIENELLYETSPFVKNKYMEERPKTPEISNKAPGRMGVWLGWQIVRSYMDKNQEVTLPELMQTTDVQKIFIQSKYKPEDGRG